MAICARSPVTVVTGAAGWLGMTLVRALADGGAASGVARPRLRALVRSTTEVAELRQLDPTLEAVVGDVRDPATVGELFEGVAGAAVYHAAGVIHPGSSTREFFDVNVGGTALVLDRARRAGVRRLVHVSSNSPFGFNRTSADVFDEDSPYNPYMGYGRSKMEAEVLVKQSHARGDMETVIVRCPWFYGPYQPPRQTRLFALVRRGRFPLFGDGHNRRSMVYTDNLAQGLILAQHSDQAVGRSYWVADARPYTMREILESIRAALRAEGFSLSERQVHLPRLVTRMAAAADGLLQKTGRYSQEIHVLSEMSGTISCTIERARDELGYQPEVGVEEGMRRSLRWALEHGATV